MTLLSRRSTLWLAVAPILASVPYTGARAGFGVSVPSIDPFQIKELLRAPGENLWKNNAGYDDPGGKTLRTSYAINPAQKTLILISAGQSNSGNINPSAYVPTNASAIDNFSIYDGAFYRRPARCSGVPGRSATGPGMLACAWPMRLSAPVNLIGLFWCRSKSAAVPLRISPPAVRSTTDSEWR